MQIRKGAWVVHAAAVAYREHAVAIAGAKGAGKSTTLLDLVDQPGYDYLSGDKLFLTVTGGRLYGTGWPDFPHLGWAPSGPGRPCTPRRSANSG